MIPITKPSLDISDLRYIKNVIKSKILTDGYYQKKPLRNLLIKKKLFLPAKKEKKGLVFNFNKWHNKKDLFRAKYFKTINKIWKKSNSQKKN
mgnify:CR=1 FL=1